MLRRRTGKILATVLLACVAAGLLGACYVLCVQPKTVLAIAIAAIVASCLVCMAVDEYGWLLVGLAAILWALGCGLYALFLLDAPLDAIALVASLLIGLVFVMLARAFIAAGSADYPYDE